MTLIRIKNHFGEHWPLWAIGIVLVAMFGILGPAIYGSAEESKQGWHYHLTCEEVEVPTGDTSVTVWRCKGEYK